MCNPADKPTYQQKNTGENATFFAEVKMALDGHQSDTLFMTEDSQQLVTFQ